MRAVIRDLGLAVRVLRNNIGFSLVVIVTLALGIGSNTAIFTVFDLVLLRALPIQEPERLVLLDHPGINRGWVWGSHTFSYPMYKESRDQNEVFDGLLARFSTPLNLSSGGPAERVEGVLVSGNYFPVLGKVEPSSALRSEWSDGRNSGLMGRWAFEPMRPQCDFRQLDNRLSVLPWPGGAPSDS